MTRIAMERILAVGEALFSDVGVERAVASSWLQVAIRRDAVGDFARGMQRLPCVLERVESGDLGPRLDVASERLGPMSARVRAAPRHWPDQVGQYAAGLAVGLAREHGIGLVAFPKPSVVGATLGPVVEAEMLGAVVVQNAPLMNHPGVAARSLVGNNPIAFCAPGDPPFLFDGALSQHSLFGLLDASRRGRVPAGAVLDGRGDASSDPEIVERVARREREAGSLAPLGGVKGLGLAMCAEFLAGALTGGFYEPPAGKPWGEGALVAVLRASLFGADDEMLAARTGEYLAQFDTYPGLHSERLVSAGLKEGVEYPEEAIEALEEEADRRGLEARRRLC
jgi:LDH2 family malate/lactate/ureidoglycolate dehydrogenase